MLYGNRNAASALILCGGLQTLHGTIQRDLALVIFVHALLMLQAFLGADAGSLGTVLVDVLRVLGAVHQHHHIGGGHLSNAVAHQHLAGLTVHGELCNAHVQGHQHGVVPGLHAVHAVAGGQGQALAVALIEFTAGSRDVQDELIDRYGEIPRSVQNLLDIALYKSRAAQLGILNFTVHPEEVRFTFGADAPLDGAKLFAAVGTIDGAAFAAGEKIALVIKNKHKTGEEMFRIAQDAVNTLLLCTENAG